MLAFPDHAKPFEIDTDASDYAIGGVLMQARGHLIAYKSRKLNETERKYKVQEKERTAIVYCLRTWRHYLLGVVRTEPPVISKHRRSSALSKQQGGKTSWLSSICVSSISQDI